MDKLIEFFTDPLRLTLLVAGVVVVLGILIFGRRSRKMEARLYHGHSNRDFNFNNPPPDLLVDEEIIVLPPRKKESEVTTEDNAVAVEEFEASTEAVNAEAATANATPKVEIRPMENPAAEIEMETFEYKKAPAEEIVAEEAPAAPETAATESTTQTNGSPQEGATVVTAKTEKPVQEQFIVFHILPLNKETFNGNDIHQVAGALGLAFGKHNVYHFPADNAREGNSQFCLVNMTSAGDFDKASMSQLETKGVSLILRLNEKTTEGLAMFSNMLAIAQGIARRLGGEILDQTRTPVTPDVVTSLRSDIAKFQTKLNQRTPASIDV
ncbi:MAG: cell division protein ZipA C-terminal FtsZ-binding domain-containing protein [Gammaproteobacteria bacterium]|nr:cell division protein ZipA C-terminal FtsZ-binding domain-containing protein [Gammaproteobacteria bacterium]